MTDPDLPDNITEYVQDHQRDAIDRGDRYTVGYWHGYGDGYAQALRDLGEIDD